MLSITALSDTHSSFSQMEELAELQTKGDIFIHAGDFTRYGRQEHFLKFFNLLQKINFRHKIVIAGNHQISLDEKINPQKRKKLLQKYQCKYSRQELIVELKKRCIYLQHQLVQIEGLRIFASPFSQRYSSGAFQYRLDEEHHIWSTLPDGIDILVTHMPPYGILDVTHAEKNVGSHVLRKRVFQVKPKYHIFGHIHESHGTAKIENITFMNVAKKCQSFKWPL